MIDAKRIIGSPWTLLNISDFFIIGLMSVLFMLTMQIAGLAWHRFNLWRFTGSTVSPASPAVSGSAADGDANASSVTVESV